MLPKGRKLFDTNSVAERAGSTETEEPVYIAYAILPKKGLHVLRTLTVQGKRVIAWSDNVENLKMIQIGHLQRMVEV